MKLIGRVLQLPKANSIAFILFVSVFTPFLSAPNTYADNLPNLEPIQQTTPVVESPSGVTATSPSNDQAIVWTWLAPAGGLTPGAAAPAVGEQGNPIETLATQRPTDIIRFGYELSKEGAPLTVGAVESSALTVTTPVAENGDYTLYVWSINRAGEVSAKVSGAMSVFIPIPNLPPIEEGSIPAYIDTVPAEVKPIEGSASAPPVPIINSSDTPGYIANAPSSIVLPTNTMRLDPIDEGNEAEVAGVVKASSQGWVVLGTPWYFWLSMVAVVFITIRLAMTFRRSYNRPVPA